MTRPVPPCDLAREARAMRGGLEGASRRVFKAGRFIDGEEGHAFEGEFARYLGVRWAVGVSSGTDALRMALTVCGVGRGDEVILPAMTFVATAEAVIHTGARPVLVDIDPKTYCIDVRALEKAVTAKTRAVIPVHLYGHPAEMKRVQEIAARFHLDVVEDAAQAHGARAAGRRVGTFGRMSCFSFYPTKNLGAFGDAGLVAGRSPGDEKKVRRLINHGALQKNEHEEVGFTARLDELQAAYLRVKLPFLERWNQKRRSLAALYDRLLQGLPIVRPAERRGDVHVYHQYVIRCGSRDRVLRRLVELKVGALIHYPRPLHLVKSLCYLGYRKGRFPVSEQLARTALSLPIYPEMSPQDVQAVVAALRRALAGTEVPR